MKKASAAGTPSIDPGHAVEEHVYAELLGFLSEEHTLTSIERRRINAHLTHCIECQTLVGKYLVDAITYLKKHGQDAARVQATLERLSRLTHKTLKKDIPAYAEVADNNGEGRARERFPFLAAHLEICEGCRLVVHDLCEWLREENKVGSGKLS